MKCPYGVVTSVNGFYGYVTPVWCEWEVEFYENELVLAEDVWDVKRQRKNIEIKEVNI
jgi:hypothetical protein